MESTAASPRVQPDVSHEGIDSKTPAIFSFFEKATGTWQYIISDPQTHQAVIVDPVLDYDPASGTISTKSADDLLSFIEDKKLNVTHILETHAHADHLTSSRYLKSCLHGTPSIGIGARITQVQKTFAPVYGYDDPSIFENSFDIYWKDDEEFKLGGYNCRVVHLPGHTPDHVGYVFGSAVFTGDSIFNPDVGSARADFPGGNAKDLYSSMQRLLSLPEDSLLFVGHDYPPNDTRTPLTSVAVREHQAVWKGKDEVSFVEWRQSRDATLGAPRLLHSSLQVNILGGRLPPQDQNGRRWLKTPVRGAPECLTKE
ncbi:Metallo-hydrolase/oxidoreductase [Irpex rosettiformis]|uniref:Metallo-hydrolase/oxidoreductase n=1 Tax=Irpex rosettiformis TaxID=378272 RepID=A0ACB8U1S4_9APHY|nr:Metallo-hydrolase/oxidoreductase [Irpex rosettiformis]